MNRARLAPAALFVGLGILIVLFLSDRRGPLPRLVESARAQGTAADSQPDVELLKADVEILKQKATDQAHVMTSVSYHFNNLWFAGQHGNWPLAQFYLNETRSHLRWAVRVIPIRKDSAGYIIDLPAILEAVENTPLKQLEEAIKAERHDEFVNAYKFTLEACYMCHKAAEKPYLRPQIPSQPADAMVNFEPAPATHEQPPQFRVPEGAVQPEGEKTGQAAKPNDPAASNLIEPAELEQRLQEPKLRIVDSRSQDEYSKGHIPQAVWVDVASWQDLGRTAGGFRNAQAWGEKVGHLGIDRATPVIVYGSRLPDTARIWWTLKYLGLDDVMILNGGWDIWLREGRPTDAIAPKIAVTRFEPKFQADRLEEIETLKQSVPSGTVTLVDARSTGEFTGQDVRGKRGGHITGATHLEWSELLAEDGRFKTRDQLRELFRDRGILPDETAVCY